MPSSAHDHLLRRSLVTSIRSFDSLRRCPQGFQLLGFDRIETSDHQEYERSADDASSSYHPSTPPCRALAFMSQAFATCLRLDYRRAPTTGPEGQRLE
jgi:hypothetical protein